MIFVSYIYDDIITCRFRFRCIFQQRKMYIHYKKIGRKGTFSCRYWYFWNDDLARYYFHKKNKNLKQKWFFFVSFLKLVSIFFFWVCCLDQPFRGLIILVLINFTILRTLNIITLISLNFKSLYFWTKYLLFYLWCLLLLFLTTLIFIEQF